MTPMTSLVLIRPHTHAGQAHKAGERLDVDGILMAFGAFPAGTVVSVTGLG